VDRRFRSDDPDTPGNTHWEINMGFVGQRSPFGGSYETPIIGVVGTSAEKWKRKQAI